MNQLSSKDLKQYLADWTTQSLEFLPVLPDVHHSNPNGTKQSHWTRRGKGVINGETVRAFECYCSTRSFPGEYAVVFEKAGQIYRLEWMSEIQVLQFGLRIQDCLGTIWYWHNGEKKSK